MASLSLPALRYGPRVLLLGGEGGGNVMDNISYDRLSELVMRELDKGGLGMAKYFLRCWVWGFECR